MTMNPDTMRERLNALLNVPFELWRERGVSLAAVSANADGFVNSGLVRRPRMYFTRVHQTAKDAAGHVTFTGKSHFEIVP